MNEKFKQVPTRGITTEELLALWREGKLYQAVGPTEEELLLRCRKEALRYVAAVNEFVAPEWLPYIDDVWQAIVNDEAFTDGFVMKKKHQLNRYFLTGLVFNMQARGAYFSIEKVSQLRLHLKLEGVCKKNSIYKNIVNYPLNTAQRKRLSKIFENFIGLKKASF